MQNVTCGPMSAKNMTACSMPNMSHVAAPKPSCNQSGEDSNLSHLDLSRWRTAVCALNLCIRWCSASADWNKIQHIVTHQQHHLQNQIKLHLHVLMNLTLMDLSYSFVVLSHCYTAKHKPFAHDPWLMLQRLKDHDFHSHSTWKLIFFTLFIAVLLSVGHWLKYPQSLSHAITINLNVNIR